MGLAKKYNSLNNDPKMHMKDKLAINTQFAFDFAKESAEDFVLYLWDKSQKFCERNFSKC
ncbi:MAG: hypothetical protein HYX60_08920 [Legionella longbeachae]|nr:hypothetical protein [Legionella longbeachae]